MDELTRRQLARAVELEERAARGVDVEYSVKWARRHRAMAAAAVRRRSWWRLMVTAVVVGLAVGGCYAGRQPPVGPSSSVASPASPSATSQVPGSMLNPAVTQANIHQTICVSGWTATVRPSSSYTNDLKRKQLPQGANLADYEEDHRIPLELGGAPRNPVGDDGKVEVSGNLWPEPIDDARTKDKVENVLNTAVCNGRTTLAAAQLQMFEWPVRS